MLGRSEYQSYQENGFLIMPDFISESWCETLKERAEWLVNNHPKQDAKTLFDTDEDSHTSNAYFLNSSDECALFYEKDDPTALRVNKIGHALHEKDEIFSDFSRQPAIQTLVSELGVKSPRLVQSMYIFKHAEVGGEVSLHQDASFLISEPDTLLGLWFALDDATTENGCLWALPGGHHSPVHTYFIRQNKELVFDKQYDPDWDESLLKPLEVKRGSLVILHSRLPHVSYANRSSQSRHAFALHLISGESHYSSKNWLQKQTALRGF